MGRVLLGILWQVAAWHDRYHMSRWSRLSRDHYRIGPGFTWNNNFNIDKVIPVGPRLRILLYLTYDEWVFEDSNKYREKVVILQSLATLQYHRCSMMVKYLASYQLYKCLNILAKCIRRVSQYPGAPPCPNQSKCGTFFQNVRFMPQFAEVKVRCYRSCNNKQIKNSR